MRRSAKFGSAVFLAAAMLIGMHQAAASQPQHRVACWIGSIRSVLERQDNNLGFHGRFKLYYFPLERGNLGALHARIEVVCAIGPRERFFDTLPHRLLWMVLGPVFFARNFLFRDTRGVFDGEPGW